MPVELWTLAVIPAELRLPAQSRAGGNGERAGLHIAHDDTALLQFDERCLLDVALELARDRHPVGANGTGQLGAGFDGEVALDIDVALELAGDADAATAFDLALDRDVGGNQRFLARTRGFRTRRRSRRCRCRIGHGRRSRGRLVT